MAAVPQDQHRVVEPIRVSSRATRKGSADHHQTICLLGSGHLQWSLRVLEVHRCHDSKVQDRPHSRCLGLAPSGRRRCLRTTSSSGLTPVHWIAITAPNHPPTYRRDHRRLAAVGRTAPLDSLTSSRPCRGCRPNNRHSMSHPASNYHPQMTIGQPWTTFTMITTNRVTTGRA
jgi:hypothetical protein